MRFAIVLALLVSLQGCSFAHPLHGDITFTPEERAAIERGDALIADRVGRDPVGVVWDAPHPIDDQPEGPCVQGTIIRTKGIGGSHRRGCLRIGTDDPAYFERVATHELGHWYGLCHHDGPGIMNDAVTSAEWTIEDEASKHVRSCVR